MVNKITIICDAENKSYEELSCGYKIYGNRKKCDLVKRLHTKKCEQCQNYNKFMKEHGNNLIKEGEQYILYNYYSDEKKMGQLMKKGVDYHTARERVTKMKGETISS